MPASRKILIGTYLFPPSRDVGARRWAKFAKYLAHDGWDVFVVCRERILPSDLDFWNNETVHPGIHVIEIPRNYPDVLETVPRNILEKIKYKWEARKLKKSVSGNIYDRAILWRDQFVETCSRIIESEGIENMIVTGAPFRLCHFAVQLKRKYGMRMACDFRDPWTWGQHFGYHELDPDAAKLEKMLEEEVVSASDHIFVPVGVMASHLRQAYPDFASKIHVLPHTADPDDIPVRKKSATGNLVKRFLIYGSLYRDLDNEMKEMAGFFRENPGLASLEIYSDQEIYRDVFLKNGMPGNVHYHHGLPASDLFRHIYTADFVIFLSPEFARNYLSTKFFEVVFSGTPIVVAGENGECAKFVANNDFGVFLPSGNISKGLTKLCREGLPKNYNFDFDISDHLYPALTKRLINEFLLNQNRE